MFTCSLCIYANNYTEKSLRRRQVYPGVSAAVDVWWFFKERFRADRQCSVSAWGLHVSYIVQQRRRWTVGGTAPVYTNLSVVSRKKNSRETCVLNHWCNANASLQDTDDRYLSSCSGLAHDLSETCNLLVSWHTKQVSAVANWPARRNRAADRAWRSMWQTNGRASELGGTVNLVDQRQSSLSRSEGPPFSS